jgi:ribosomal protein S18 acetylase RimI-like enzyme
MKVVFMTIRLARSDDKENVIKLYHSLSDEYKDEPNAFLQALKHSTTQVYLLEENSVIVGTAAVSYKVDPCIGLIGIIDSVVVEPQYRGRGFGEALVQHCIKSSKHEGCKRVDLTSQPSRVEANSLYKKLEFEIIQTNFYILRIP